TLTLRLEQSWIPDDDDRCHSPRSSHVESIQTVQELHPPRRVLWRGSSKRINHHRRLLSLKFIHGSNTRPCWKLQEQVRHLSIVGRHDQNILNPYLLATGPRSEPLHSGGHQTPNNSVDYL